jgi:pectin methylesterase-like acyl-CoA thioesterase
MATYFVSPAASVRTRLQRNVLNARGCSKIRPGTALAVACLAVMASLTHAQAPVAIPETSTVLAGGANGAGTGVSGMVLPASGAACFAGSSLKATDAYGDGCPGPYTTFSTDFRGGVGADGAGNVYVIETTEALLRKIDAKSGIVTAVTGTAITGCTTNSDGYGDGCPLTQTKLGSARGGGVDPYGNVIIAGYNMNTINIVCNAVSPLCPNTANHKRVGYMYRIAGCAASATASGTASAGSTAGSAGDGAVASPYGNLSGDVTDWGGGSSTFGACSSTLGGVNTARGANADKYGNVYIADTGNLRHRVVVGPPTFTLPNGTVLTNPLANIIALNPTYSTITPATAYGHIYPILGFFSTTNGGVTSPTTAGVACAGPSGGVTLDTIGDGCPYYESTGGASTSSTLGVGVDSEGNPILLDQNNKVVRVLYISGPNMAAAIQKANNNPSLTITPGYYYPLIGLGGASGSGISFTPTLGTATAINSNGNRMAVDPAGNLYFSDYGKNSVYMFDLQTGYARNVLVTGSACSTATPDYDSVGDGCSGTVFGSTVPTSSPFSFGAGGGSTIGIAMDPQGNLIIGDIANSLIRRITAAALAPVRVGTNLTQQVTIHAPAGATGISASLLATSPDITAGAATCAAAANADSTLDCQVPITFAPLTPGQRSAVLTVSDTGVKGTASFAVTVTATGAALVADVASPTVNAIGTVTSATSLAVDGSGNVFTIDSGKFVETSAGGVSAAILGTPPSTPYQVAVDTQDNVYATNGGTAITKDTLSAIGTYSSSTITPLLPLATYTASPILLTSTPAIYGIAVDRLGNIFFSDRSNEAVFEIPAGSLLGNLSEIVPIVTGFNTVGELALDGSGNLLIADTGAGKVYRLMGNTPLFPTPTIASALASTPIDAVTVASGIVPTHIASDAGGNAYIQDASAKTVTEVPVAGATATVYTTVNAPQGIAVDGTGVVYEAEANLTSINAIARNAFTYTFPNISTTLPLILSNTGNLASTGSASTDSAEFPITTGSTNGCGSVPSVANPLAAGSACTSTASFTPGNNGNLVSSVTTMLPTSSSIGALTLKGQEPVGVTYSTTTTVTGTSSAVYAGSGAEITFTVSESSTNSNSQNGEAVNVTIDTGTAVPYTLSGGSVSVPVSGLLAGPHTITAVYPGDGTYLTSNGSANFTITQAPTTVTWTPAATTQQYSAAIGTSVLNATANAAGSFIYTATPQGGSPQFIHSASYLPIGTYSLGVTFVPTDSVNYGSSIGSIASYTVTQATTTAPVGATQMLVASDGTGNYSTVQSAVNALPSGGSVYIKPGTYPGFITVVQPNVALRGLGGDPTQVILTHEAGAFGGTYAYTGEFQATGINAGNGGSNGWQLPAGSTLFTGDEGSATLVAAKGVNTAVSSSTTIPNGLYAENLSLINGYDTDTATTTTTYEPTSNGTCTLNEGPAMSYSALYNAGTLCASQALAIWMTADLAVMNNVYTTSLQDTIYAASQGSGSNGYVPSRQYWFRGKVTGDVDYIFGDAAAVFDNTSIYTAWHGSTATGTETIHAQNKAVQTGTSNDYLSGYVMNSDVLTSQSTGMTNLYFGRPYGTYSTWIMLNSYVDQVNPLGYTTGLGPALGPTTFGEFNDTPYTDPATGAADLNGNLYLGAGGNTGAGVTGTREASSTNPGTPMANNGIPTQLTQAQAQAYFPTNFLSQTVPSTVSSTKNWNPTAAIAASVNAFVPSGASASVAVGSSVTILMRPQTPGLGAVTNGVYTIPTGTYTLIDTVSGTPVTLASGSLDASGEAYFTSNSLSLGTHNLTWTYGGDTNFAGSTTSSAYVLTVNPVATTTGLSVSVNPIVYGQSAGLTATVTPASGSTAPTGTVTLTIDGVATQTASLSGGSAAFTVAGLPGGPHSFSASYGGSTNFVGSSTSSSSSLTVSQAVLTVTGSCSNRVYGQVNVCTAGVSGYQYTDGAAAVFSATPTGTTTAARNSPAGSYTATPLSSSLALTTFGAANYTVSQGNTSFTISGGAAQSIIFAPLPNFAHGASYQLTARATSGLPVSYSVTSGNASVSGSTLTVTGTGLVTVQASQSIDPSGDYAAATPVSRSFTAQ